MQAIRRLFRFARPYRLWIVLAPLLMLLEVCMDLLQPRMMQRIIDQGIARLDLPLVLNTGALMVGLALIGAVGGIGCTIYAIKASQAFGADVRQALLRHVLTFSFGNLDALETGQLVTRLTNDVTQVQEALAMLVRVLVRSPLLLLGSLIMAILTSPQLALLLVILLPLELVMVAWVVRKATPMYGVVQGKLDGLNQVMEENLAGVRVVKAFGRAQHEQTRFGAANDALMEQTLRVARTVAVTMPYMMLSMNVGVVAVLWFGGIQINQGQMQVGQVIAFINYLLTTLSSLVMVSMLVIQMARAQASAERIDEVFASVPVVRDAPSPVRGAVTQGRVAFEGVSFSYEGDGQAAVLQGVSFVAEPGQQVALLGSTGAGKSSLVHLIPRFYDPSGGRVLLDGVDVRQMAQDDLRRRVGVALQEAVLFSGSIRDNIRYGQPTASDAQVEAAARMAQAHDFIVSCPQGYDTLVGQRGVNLSGGQKQRLAIARALLIQPAVLILDDSTSSVDVETEARLQAALRAFMRGRTCFIIAQRISSVLQADKILVLEEGRIAAEGTHTQLMATSPIYREIYDSQLGNGVNDHA